jgi:hypothetical protein
MRLHRLKKAFSDRTVWVINRIASIGVLALAGNHGGLHTIRSAFLASAGNKLACLTVIYDLIQLFYVISRIIYARRLLSVAITAFNAAAAFQNGRNHASAPVPISEAVWRCPMKWY